LGGYSIDDALTGGKAQVANEVRTAAREALDRLGVGIALNDVSVEGIEPPFAVSDAFKDVSSARKDREKTIDQAHGFAETILPRAGGRAAEILADARSFAEQRRNQAKGQAERFSSLLAEYRKAPEVTRTRLVMATLTRAFERAETYVITPNEDGPPLRLTISEGD
jgi:membrane protease subunit HflK